MRGREMDTRTRVKTAIWKAYLVGHAAPLRHSSDPTAITDRDLDRMTEAALSAISAGSTGGAYIPGQLLIFSDGKNDIRIQRDGIRAVGQLVPIHEAGELPPTAQVQVESVYRLNATGDMLMTLGELRTFAQGIVVFVEEQEARPTADPPAKGGWRSTLDDQGRQIDVWDEPGKDGE